MSWESSLAYFESKGLDLQDMVTLLGKRPYKYLCHCTAFGFDMHWTGTETNVNWTKIATFLSYIKRLNKVGHGLALNLSLS